MKIRTDFVTNSSSSCFTVEISILSKNENIGFCENPYKYNPDCGGEATFVGDLRDVNSHLSSVEELATWLADSVKQDSLRCEYTKRGIVAFEKTKTEFINDAKTKIKSVRDIDSIVVERRYDAWGEFADLIADNDDRLVELAKKYLNSTGIDKERAEAEMVTYIQTSNMARGESFGCNSAISRYNWSGNSVKKLAKRLVSGYAPETVSGVERKELNLKTGEYFDESKFDLT